VVEQQVDFGRLGAEAGQEGVDLPAMVRLVVEEVVQRGR
jgi:hypothetical protein